MWHAGGLDDLQINGMYTTLLQCATNQRQLTVAKLITFKDVFYLFNSSNEKSTLVQGRIYNFIESHNFLRFVYSVVLFLYIIATDNVRGLEI